MIANKLSILEETSTIKDGCCIPVLQDTETKRISYNTLKNMILSEVEQCISKVDSTPLKNVQVYDNDVLMEYTENMTVHKNTSGKTKFSFDCDGKTYLVKDIYTTSSGEVKTTYNVYNTTKNLPFYTARQYEYFFYEIDEEKNILCQPIKYIFNSVA